MRGKQRDVSGGKRFVPEDDAPDFKNRSALTISPGLWVMRCGHTAQIDKLDYIRYVISGQEKRFPIWKGMCVECNESKTWNENGTYAANGKHQYDILRKSDAP